MGGRSPNAAPCCGRGFGSWKPIGKLRAVQPRPWDRWFLRDPEGSALCRGQKDAAAARHGAALPAAIGQEGWMAVLVGETALLVQEPNQGQELVRI